MAENTVVRRRNWIRGRNAAIRFLKNAKRTARAQRTWIESTSRPGLQAQLFAGLAQQLARDPSAAEGFDAVLTDFVGTAFECGVTEPGAYCDWTFEDWLGTASKHATVSSVEVQHA